MSKAEGTESDFKVLPEFHRFVETVQRRKPGLSIIDGLTLVYEGGEGSRALIIRVMRRFDEVARANGGSIILIGHDNRAGEYSGSTAFENAVRARMSLEKAEADDGEEVVRLKLPKANYHGKDQIDMRYRGGCFVALSEEHMTSAERLERDMRRSQAEARFLEGVDKLTAMDVTLSASNRARYYAPKLIREKHAQLFTLKELDAAMWRLIDDGRLSEGAKLPLKQKGSRRFAMGLARPSMYPRRPTMPRM